MSERVYVDVFDDEVVLTDTVRDVILTKHPEVAAFIDRLGTVLASPDEVRHSVSDERVVLYYHYASDIFDGKWLVAVVKRIDRNLVSTLYATDKIKSGDIVWKK